MDLRKRAMRIGAWTAVIMVAMAALLAGCAHAREADPVAGGLTFKAGTYTATVPGMMGDIKVEVIFSVDRILSVRVLEHRETPVLSDAAVKGLPARIVESQSLAVDSVSGVTITSDAILEAVAECVRKAGGDVDALKARKVAAVQRAPNVRQTVDVVVIGGGGAGLSAAVTAHQAGASVLVLEKMPQVGGNTIIAAGAFNTSNLGLQRRLPAAPGPEAAIMAAINAQPASDLHREMQAQLRREFEAHRAAGSPHLFDSPTFHALQTFEGGDRKGDLALIRNYTSQSLDALKWLEGLGMRFTDTPFTVLGALWMRSHRPVRPLGTGFIETLMGYVNANQIPVMLETRAERLILRGGRAIGVEAVGPTGNRVIIRARRGVVMATGGFGRDVEMRQKHNTVWRTLDASIPSTNHPGATGEGIVIAQAAGADVVGMEYIQLLPAGDPVTGGLSGNLSRGVGTSISVNTLGNRFMAEDGRRDDMVRALFEQPGNRLWTIVDRNSYPTGATRNVFNETIDDLVAAGRAYRADTLEALAAQINVPAANLVRTVDEYNRAFERKGGDAFGQTAFLNRIDTPPFYAGARVPTIHHTMGGLRINAETQVLTPAGKVIPGLYAAGEVTGGIHGTNRLGGNALSEIIVKGRIAGANAAKN